MTVSNFPNGTILTSSALTVDEIAAVFQSLMVTILGLTPPESDSDVRIAWQNTGAPGVGFTDNVLTIEMSEANGVYNKVRDLTSAAQDEANASQTFTYTRIWRCGLVSRGPLGFDRLRLIKSALLLEWTHDTLTANSLYVVPSFERTVLLRELVEGRWWLRSDFSFEVYEGISEVTTVGFIGSAEVKVYDQSSPNIDTPVLDLELGN